MQRIVLKHLSGSKANQVEEFPLNYFTELIIGRDPSSTVKYDPERDDLVGRQHAKIARDANDPNGFVIQDLNSRNGTFVNGQRIISSVRLAPGDVVRFGAGGPEFQFDVEPRPSTAQQETQASGSPGAPPPTRTSGMPPTRMEVAATAPPISGALRQSIGKPTVERMLADSRNRSRRTTFAVAGALLLVIAAAVTLLILKLRVPPTSASPGPEVATPADIVKNSGNLVVFIQSAWELVHAQSGNKVYHAYTRNLDSQGKPYLPGAGQYVPVYIEFADGQIEPCLIDKESKELRPEKPICGSLSGTGVVVHSNGFILTNRHIAAPWSTRYYPTDAHIPLPGLVFRLKDNSESEPLHGDSTDRLELRKIEEPTDSLRDWVPEKSRSFGRELIRGKLLAGRSLYLEVTFPNTETPYRAALERPSVGHDIAMVKINTPNPVNHVVELIANEYQVQPGDAITIMGYPVHDADIVVGVPDPAISRRQYKYVAYPSVTTGLVGKVIRDQQQSVDSKGSRDFIGEVSDSIQLSANAIGPGNSGSPVFNDQGKVIALIFRGKDNVAFAVPIHYGKELMDPLSAVK